MSWDYYFCEVEGERATNAVDLCIEAPQAARPYLVYLRVIRDEQTLFGLGEAEERKLLDGIENHLGIVAADYDAAYVGRSTTKQARTFVLYAPKGETLAERLERTASHLGDYGFRYFARAIRDADWSVYRDFLCPGPNERIAIAEHRHHDPS